MGNYPPRLRRLHFLPAKGYGWVGNSLPSQELFQNLGIVEEERKAAATCIILTLGHSDLGNQKAQQGKARQISLWSNSLSSSWMNKYKEVPKKRSRIMECSN